MKFFKEETLTFLFFAWQQPCCPLKKILKSLKFIYRLFVLWSTKKFFYLNSGLQDVLPDFLRNRFVEAALSYVACNSEGELLCRNNDCWCRCSAKFPDCNCPFLDIRAMEESLRKSRETWFTLNNDFIESGKDSPTLICLVLTVVCLMQLVAQRSWDSKVFFEKQLKSETCILHRFWETGTKLLKHGRRKTFKAFCKQ